MADVAVIRAETRDAVGTGAARAMRRAGRVPAIIYGGGGAPAPVSLDPRELAAELARPAFFATLYDVAVDGANERVLAREVQRHPVSDTPMHVDFLRVTASTRLAVEIPVDFVNEEESPGLKQGGVLNIVRHRIEVNCRADSIPSAIAVDLAGRQIGDSVHISEVSLPDGVVPTIADRDFTIATVVAPSVMPIEEEEEPEIVYDEEGNPIVREAAEGDAEAGPAGEEEDAGDD